MPTQYFTKLKGSVAEINLSATSDLFVALLLIVVLLEIYIFFAFNKYNKMSTLCCLKKHHCKVNLVLINRKRCLLFL